MNFEIYDTRIRDMVRGNKKFISINLATRTPLESRSHEKSLDSLKTSYVSFITAKTYPCSISFVFEKLNI